MSVSVISIGFLIGLGVVAGALWTTFGFAHQRRWSIGSRLVLALLAVLISTATAADAVNAHYQYLPRLGDVLGADTWPTVKRIAVLGPTVAAVPAAVPQKAPGHTRAASAPSVVPPRPLGAVTSIPVKSATGGQQWDGAGSLIVWLPAEYFTQPGRRFPVVYLLHGSPGMPTDWLRGGGAVRAAEAVDRAGAPMIVAIPRVSRSWLDDSECVDGRREHVETYLLHDVVPSVDRQLRTIPSRDARAVAGMSAGGYCALNLGVRNRDLFSAIVDLSGYDHPTHAGGMRALFGLGPDVPRLVAANTPADWLAAHPVGAPLIAWLGCGADDPVALRDIRHVQELFGRYGIPSSLHLRDGGHTYAVWRPELRQALGWLGTRLTGAAPGPFAAS